MTIGPWRHRNRPTAAAWRRFRSDVEDAAMFSRLGNGDIQNRWAATFSKHDSALGFRVVRRPPAIVVPPVSPPPLRRVDHQRPFLQRDPREAARHHALRPEESTKGRRSMWRGAMPDSTKVGQVDSDQRRLRDEDCPGWPSPRRKSAISSRRGGADQHAVAAGAVHFLDHQVRQVSSTAEGRPACGTGRSGVVEDRSSPR